MPTKELVLASKVLAVPDYPPLPGQSGAKDGLLIRTLSRAGEARRSAASVRRARQAAAETRSARPTRNGAPSRWRAWGWSLTPRAFGSARLLPR